MPVSSYAAKATFFASSKVYAFLEKQLFRIN